MEHKHHGKSSAKFLNADEILKPLDFKGNETFMDAGCGDGYISINAIEKYLSDGTVYAVDVHDESIDSLEEFKKENNVENLIGIKADITKAIPGVEDESVDVVLMVNVFHGFTSGKEIEVINEFSRIIKADGKIAIVDFNPIEIPHGPPVDIKIPPKDLEKLFANYNFEKIYLNEDMGAEYPNGKSHYMIIFKKE